MDERELISRVRAGDAGAERALYDTHVDRVYRLAFRLTGNDDRARDYTQEAFIRVFDRLETFRGDSALSTWIYAIAHSVILNGLRREKRFRNETDLDHGTQVASGGRQAEPDLKTRLNQAIDALPEKYRVPFVMHEVEGFTHEEIAEVQGIEIGTSKAQVSRAKAKLRETLAQFAGEWTT